MRRHPLVELIAEYIRYNRYAVLALIEHFGDEKPLPGQKSKDSVGLPNPDHLAEHLNEWIDNNRSENLLLGENELAEVEASWLRKKPAHSLKSMS